VRAFVWDQRFATGLDKVDQQHRHLVEVVNRVGDLLLDGAEADAGSLRAIFRQLADYTRYHFSEEERLMKEAGLDARYVGTHVGHHAEFVEQVVAMWKSRAAMGNPSGALHGFLSAWLTSHILGEDQSMARQVARVRAGQTAAEAYAAETSTDDGRTSVLLDALRNLYQVLSVQNRDLAEANRHLEEKVAERTAELARANAALRAEQEELLRLLAKVDEAQNLLVQSEKMAAVGQLAAGVAHEINNPVSFVYSNLGTLEDYLDRLLALVRSYEQAERAMPAGGALDQLRQARVAADLGFLRQDVQALLQESRTGLDRVRGIVNNLRDFSHVDQAEWQEVDLNVDLESTLRLVAGDLERKARVVREYGRLPRLRCIPGQINQVFLNLLLNAVQALDEGGTITVRSGAEEGRVWVEIADDGRGMTPEVRKRIFEPFFTTRAAGRGTGLGLSLAYDIVKRHQGSMEVHSEPGRGSRFRVWLPTS
jgi:two-component system, NtrC family, sensor kinase